MQMWCQRSYVLPAVAGRPAEALGWPESAISASDAMDSSARS